MGKTVSYIGLALLISSLLGSCVSKKKYEELARAKRESDRNVSELKREKSRLEKDLQNAKDDFNTIRYKLTENNAGKDKTIDQLYTQLRSLESKQVLHFQRFLFRIYQLALLWYLDGEILWQQEF